MSTPTPQPASSILPPPPGQRFGVATASSLGFHAVVLLLLGVFAGRTPLRSEVFIPVELIITHSGQGQLVLGGGRPDAPPKPSPAPAEPARELPRAKPSTAGGKVKAAPAPPKLLTSKQGKEPAGPQAAGSQAAGPGGLQDASAGVNQGPGVAEGPPPVYPKHALDRGLEGRVVLSVSVAEDGAVSSVSVEKSSGHALLDEAAARAVRESWVFRAALKGGRAAAGQITITIEFSAGKVQAR